MAIPAARQTGSRGRSQRVQLVGHAPSGGRRWLAGHERSHGQHAVRPSHGVRHARSRSGCGRFCRLFGQRLLGLFGRCRQHGPFADHRPTPSAGHVQIDATASHVRDCISVRRRSRLNRTPAHRRFGFLCCHICPSGKFDFFRVLSRSYLFFFPHSICIF